MNKSMICAEILIYAGGGWNGHVVFQVVNPITKKRIATNFLVDVELFCQKQNLYFDRETMVNEILPKLNYDPKYGWLVPIEKIEEHTPWSSASKYLKEIQKDLFL